MKVAITGHRPPRLAGHEKEVEYWIEEQLKNFKACYKDVVLITGMAMGVDQIAALLAIKLGIKVHCYFPFEKYNFTKTEQYIMDNAEKVIFCEKRYTSKQTYIARDRKVVEDCDVLMVVFDGRATGGTYYTYEYGKTLDKNIFMYPWKMRR